MMKKIYGPVKKNKDELGNFKVPQHTQKTPYFAFLKTIQLLY